MGNTMCCKKDISSPNISNKEVTHFDNIFDENNSAAIKVLQGQGPESAFEFMTKDRDTGETLSYAEIRSRYG